jgi:hypothetical protein
MELFLEGLYYVGIAIAAGSALCSVILLAGVSSAYIIHKLENKLAEYLEKME